MSTARVAALIVAYMPQPAQISRLIGVLAHECAAVYVMDNGGGAEAIGKKLACQSRVRIIDMGGNRGIGNALNAGFELCAEAGFPYVTTFDQDSEPDAGQVTRLAHELETLLGAGSKVAAVGPRIVDRRGADPIEHPFVGRAAGWPVSRPCSPGCRHVESDFLITSGTVVSMAAFRNIGGFDPGLFVDYTDFEWCFRALRKGYRVLGVCSVTMTHELSAGASQRVFGVSILRYGAARRYYYSRNALLLVRRSHIPPGWKIRLAAGLAFRAVFLPLASRFSPGWRRDWSMLCKGIVDGLRSRDGCIPGPLD